MTENELKNECLKHSSHIVMALVIARTVCVSLMIGCITTATIYFQNPWLLLWLWLPAILTPSGSLVNRSLEDDNDDD